MKKSTLFLLFLVLTIDLFSQTNREILSSLKTFIENNNGNMVSGSFWTVPSTSNNIWRGQTELIIKQQLKLSSSSYEQSGYNRNNMDGSWNGILLQYLPKDPKKEIEYFLAKQIYQDILNIFGQPNRITDYGFLSESPYRYTFVAQWDKDRYTIQMDIFDIGFVDNKPGIWAMALQICNRGTFENVVPLMGIRIRFNSGIYRIDSNYAPGLLNWRQLLQSDMVNYAPMIVILDYNEKKALNQSFFPKGEITNISNSYATIIFYSNNKTKTIEVLLNRNTGEAEVINYDDNGNPSLKLKGIAETMDLQFRPRF
jgi:hypothetical protein